MIVNLKTLIALAPIKGMVGSKQVGNGVSWGLSETGYDIRMKQEVKFTVTDRGFRRVRIQDPEPEGRASTFTGTFVRASSVEEFDMPDNLAAVVHDKSTWARKGLSVLNTVIEPGWRGFLTLELNYFGNKTLVIPAGSGIAQVLFHEVANPIRYEGKYQDQPDRPVSAKES